MLSLLRSAFTPPQPAAQPLNFDHLLAPVFEVARHSASLVAGRHPTRIGDQEVEIPNFLLLGQRGGGKPVRVALFAGLDAGREETVYALSRLLVQFEVAPRLARDFALFAYPVVNALGFATPRAPLAEFQRRFAAETSDGDVQFYKSELPKWIFDGLITLRFDSAASGFHAVHRSAVIGTEVVAPALDTISASLPIRPHARTLRPDDRFARLADHAHGKLAASAGGPPYPFEIEIFAPGTIPMEDRISGLFLIVQELLRNYRRLIAHAAHI